VFLLKAEGWKNCAYLHLRNLVFLTIFDVPLVFQYFSDSAHLSTRCEVTFTLLNVINVYVCTCISKLCNTEVSLNDVEGTPVQTCRVINTIVLCTHIAACF